MKRFKKIFLFLSIGLLMVTLFSCKKKEEPVEDVQKEEETNKEVCFFDNTNQSISYHFTFWDDQDQEYSNYSVVGYQNDEIIENLFFDSCFYEVKENLTFFHLSIYDYNTYETKNYLCKAIENGIVSKIELANDVPVGMFTKMDEKGILTHELVDDNKILFHNTKCYSDIEVDFNNNSYTCDYLLTIADVDNNDLINVKKSKAGDYIVETYGNGAADVLNNDLFLIENNKSSTTYLGNIGNMYGLNVDYGFFANGDVYLFSEEDFVIYKNGKLHFQLGNRFRLGNQSDGNYNVLLAARRNSDESYIFVYASDNNVDYKDWQKEATYQIVFMDQNGDVKKIVDTNRHLLYSQFGYQELSMTLEGTSLLHFETRVRDVTSKFTYNIDSGEITVEQENSYQ